jgi:hypothetical protein
MALHLLVEMNFFGSVLVGKRRRRFFLSKISKVLCAMISFMCSLNLQNTVRLLSIE